jgi:hypothetical protein
MPAPRVLAAALSALVLAGCGAIDNREWMKVGEKYTTEEFRRDVRECSKSGKVNDECMRARGWVSVSPGRSPDKAQEQQPPIPPSAPYPPRR